MMGEADHDGLAPETVRQGTENLALFARFLREQLANPDDMAPSTKAGESLVLLPYDDPAHGVRNLAMAKSLLASGLTRRARLQRVAVPRPPDPRWQETRQAEDAFGDLTPYWPPADRQEGAPAAGYDPNHDLLVIDLTGGARAAGAALPMNAFVWLLIDPKSQDVVGLAVPHLRDLAEREPALLADLLALVSLDAPPAAATADPSGNGLVAALTRRPLPPFAGEVARLIA